MRAENVIDRAKGIFGAHKIRKRLVQEVHPDSHINHSARSAPGSQAWGYAERCGIQLLIEPPHISLHCIMHLIFCGRVQVRQCPDRRPTTDTHLLRGDHLREQLLQPGLVGLGAIGGNSQFQSRRPLQADAKRAAASPSRRRRRCAGCGRSRRMSSLNASHRALRGGQHAARSSSRRATEAATRHRRWMGLLVVPRFDRGLEAVFR